MTTLIVPEDLEAELDKEWLGWRETVERWLRPLERAGADVPVRVESAEIRKRHIGKKIVWPGTNAKTWEEAKKWLAPIDLYDLVIHMADGREEVVPDLLRDGGIQGNPYFIPANAG